MKQQGSCTWIAAGHMSDLTLKVGHERFIQGNFDLGHIMDIIYDGDKPTEKKGVSSLRGLFVWTDAVSGYSV